MAFHGAWGWWGKRSELIRPLLISFFLDWLVRGSEIIGNSNQSCHQANQSQRTASWQLQIRSWGSCSPPLSYFRGLKSFKMRIHFFLRTSALAPQSAIPQPDQSAKTSMQHNNQQTSKFSNFPLTKKHAEACIKMHKVLCRMRMQCGSAVVSGLLVLPTLPPMLTWMAWVCGDARKVCLAAACSFLVTWVGLVATCCVGGGTSVKNVQNH